MNLDLPDQYKIRMRELLGEEYDDYLACLGCPPCQGLRVNTRKWKPEEAYSALGVPLRPVPWTDNGFYYEGQERMAKDPYYYAGLYYLQEPSAMAPARFLPVEPGNRVLDLCAAPGGKSTELGARLCGEGLLWANDISSSRARALLKNLELFGIPNICVSGETPERLAGLYPSYFDRILVDAPCSGEGMFRREPEMVKDWLKRGPEYYAPVQRQILKHAAVMLRPGGYLMYSTCTFSVTEDEENVIWLLRECPEFELVPLPAFDGACGGIGLSGCLRLYPHRVEGEGHFLALLRKRGGENGSGADGEVRDGCGERTESAADGVLDGCGERTEAAASGVLGTLAGGRGQKPVAGSSGEFESFLRKCRISWDTGRFMQNGESVYYLPEGFLPAPGVRYLRTGLLMGTLKKGRFEPSQALAMALGADTFEDCVSFSHDDERVVRYLKGETVFLNDNEAERRGRQLICVDGHGLGFAKANGRTLKNQYYPGWRWM